MKDIAFIFPLLSGFIYGFSALIQKKASQNTASPLILSIIYTTTALIIAIPLAFSSSIRFEFNTLNTIAMIGAGFTGALGFLSYYKSLKIAPVTIVGMLVRISIVITTILGVLLFSEKFSILQVIGILLIIFGIVTPGLKDIKLIWNKGSLFALITGLSWGIGAALDKFGSSLFSSGLYNLLSYFAMLFWLIVLFVIRKEYKTLKEKKIVWSPYIILPGILNCFAYFFILTAYGNGIGVGLSNLLTQIRMPIIIFGGILLFKEKENNLLKIFGSILIIGGTILLKI